MKLTPTPARTAFVIHLHPPDSLDLSRIRHVVHLIRESRFPCVWSVAGCCSLEAMLQKGILSVGDCLALAIDQASLPSQASPSEIRETLRKRLTALQDCSGATAGFVSGDSLLLRPHAAMLVEQGIEAVLSIQKKQSQKTCPTPLPCGLWQLNYAALFPQRAMLARLFGGREAVIRSIMKASTSNQPSLIGIDAATCAKKPQQLCKFMQAIANAVSCRELRVEPVHEIVAQLSLSRFSRPQKSILRAA